MQIKILFNSASADERFSIGWGLSFLLGDRILFDTGEKGEFLMNNIREARVDLTRIKDIIISHDHWDHVGGLWDILKTRQDFNVHACPGFSDQFKKKVESSHNRLIEHSGFQEISDNVHVTGEIPAEYKGKILAEQAVVVETNKGLTVITGCAHPGILKILRLAQEHFPNRSFHAVLGGFHLMNAHPRNVHVIRNTFKELKVEKTGPTHCAGKEVEDLFKEEYGGRFISTKIGETVDV